MFISKRTVIAWSDASDYFYIICTHTESRLIRPYFDPHLLQRMSNNSPLPSGNPLRIHCTILEYAFLNRTGLKSLRVPPASVLLLIVLEISNSKVHFPTLSAAYSAETQHLFTLDLI